MPIVAWTYMAEDIETESDLIIPRFGQPGCSTGEDAARTNAQRTADESGVPQMLCKVVIVEWRKPRRPNANAGQSG